MRITRVLTVLLAVAAFAACGSDKKSNDHVDIPPIPTLLASGGTSTGGTGGSGGYVSINSYGAIRVLKDGTVDTGSNATAPASVTAVNFGTNHAVVSGGTTTVELISDPTSTIAGLYAKPSDAYLYVGDGDSDTTNDLPVTGLEINGGATLVLTGQGFWGGYGTVWLSNDLVINGTLAIDVNTASSIYIEANLINVGTGGRITTSATTDGSNAGSIYLGNGNNMTKTIINRGKIEAKGLGTGSGGYLSFYADDLIVNYGTIDASGGSSATGSGGNANEIDIYLTSGNTGTFHNSGALLAKGGDSTDSNGGSGGTGGYIYIDVNDLVASTNTSTIDASGGKSDFGSGGSGGELDVFVRYGDFHSSGTVRMNGGKGATSGGDTEAWAQYWNDGYSAYISAASNGPSGSGKGTILISGIWEANGGDGNDGSGGHGGYIYLETNSLGAVTINASVSIRGGDGAGVNSSGGGTYGLDIYTSYGSSDTESPGKMSIAGSYDLRGGSGAESGGYGGYLSIYNMRYNASGITSDVELVGFAAIDLSGGNGANGGSASSNAFQLHTYSPGGIPSGSITNEANITARGGKATGTGGTGGAGGYVEMVTGEPSDSTTIITNSGDIDISGGTGDNGGGGYGGGFGDALRLQAYHVSNSGDLTVKGGTGTTTGGNGGNITLMSTDYANTATTNSGTLSVAGGSGATAGTSGTITVDGSSPQ